MVDDPFMLVLAIITGLLAVTRVTRLIVDDDYPPIVWLKDRYVVWLVRKFRAEESNENARRADRWAKLVECPWCTAPYVALPAVVWFALLVQFPTWTVNNWLWWCVNGWAAASWVAAFATLRDQPPDSR